MTHMTPEERHEYGWVLTEFDEFVLLDEEHGRLTVLVLGED